MIEKGKAGWYFKSSVAKNESEKTASKYTENPSGVKKYPTTYNTIAPFDKSSTPKKVQSI